jgi:RNA polymerase sigma factor (sigma-70 family)
MTRQESYHSKPESTELVNPGAQNPQNVTFPESISDSTQAEVSRKEPENVDDAVGWFIFISKDVLAREQEIDLARTYNTGKQALLDLENQNISPEERESLELKVEDGYFAKEELLLSNIRLVINLAKEQRYRGLPFSDLISYGFIGLTTAVEKYDPELGFKLSTYATWWIRQAISRAVANEGRAIRIPVHIISWISEYLKAHKLLKQKLERKPTRDELAEELNMDPQNFEARLASLSLPISMNLPVDSSSSDSAELGDFIKDPNAQTTKPVEDNQFAECAAFALSMLDEREQAIFRLRFGLFDGRKYTLAEVGKRFSLSRERIRQLEAVALKKLRKNYELKEQARHLFD